MKLLKVLIPFALVPVLLMGQTGGGSVSWVSNWPVDPGGWYWAYDDASEQPFFDPVIRPIDEMEFEDITVTGSKISPMNDEPFAYTMPDSFWYYGIWYEPGDYLFIADDGWICFDNSSEAGFDNPPAISPPFPVADDPNSIIAPLWQDMSHTRTPEPTVTNRCYYQYDVANQILIVQWNQMESNSTGYWYTFEVMLTLGGQERLITEGSCGIVFSYHFIHFLYDDCMVTWDADGGATGIEDYQGEKGITYGGALANGRVIRMGYKRIFKHDIEAYAILSPGQLVLRYTPIEPKVVVRNIGQESEHFTITFDIYDESDERVYHNVIGTYSLLPSSPVDTLIAPCWEPGEIDQLYDMVLYTSLELDDCHHNDTHIVQALVHCDDTLRYDWNYADRAGLELGAENTHLLTFYGVDGGVLVKGGRTWISSLYGTGWIKMEIFEATDGCGATSTANKVGEASCKTFQAGWNEAEFGGFGTWVSSDTPGNIWVAGAPDVLPCGYFGTFGQFTWAGEHSCYGATGLGRGGMLTPSFSWGSYPSGFYTPGIELYVHLGFGEYPLSPLPAEPCYYGKPHDVTVFRMEEPNIDYIEAGVAISPEIAIANIGRQAEPDGGVFPVKFYAIDTYGKINGVENDTLFADTQQVSHIGWLGDETDDPDTLFVEVGEWMPEGVCHETEPFVFYELIGLVRLGEVGPDESDHCPYNDTVRRNVSCLLSHDVGVIDLTWPEPPDEEPDRYGPGSQITPVATVENFGYSEEHDIEVRCTVTDVDSGGVELWHSLQNISFLDWRGNPIDNPYVIDVTFPTYNILTDWHHQIIEARTELDSDECPDNDEEWKTFGRPPDVAEDVNQTPVKFALDVAGGLAADNYQVNFSVPCKAVVEVGVIDITGRQVKSLTSETCQPGEYSRTWDRTDNAGRRVAAGVYLIRMQAGEFNAVRKVLIIR